MAAKFVQGLALSLATFFVVGVSSFPTGAPVGACSTMLPKHGFSPQTSPCPYTIIAASRTYSPGSSVLVSINGPQFKGFIIQVKNKSNGQGLGHFENLNATGEAQGLACNGSSNSAATHTSREIKSNITLRWLAPPTGDSGTIYFEASVVYNFTTFWTSMISDELLFTSTGTSTEPLVTSIATSAKPLFTSSATSAQPPFTIAATSTKFPVTGADTSTVLLSTKKTNGGADASRAFGLSLALCALLSAGAAGRF